MSLKAAIRSLERKAIKVSKCTRCDGRGSWETILVENGTPERDPHGCQGCGKVAYVKHIILED
jgi:MinD superfamily P-loop ATPase